MSALGEADVVDDLQRKHKQAEKMVSELVAHVTEATRMQEEDGHNKRIILPSWISSGKELTHAG